MLIGGKIWQLSENLRMAIDSFDIDKLVGGILAICRLSHSEILSIRQQTGRSRCSQRLSSLIITRVHVSPDPGIDIGTTTQFRVTVRIYSNRVRTVMGQVLNNDLIVAIPAVVRRVMIPDHWARIC